MDRRAILKYTAYLTGYAVTAPLSSALLSGCKSEPAAPDFVSSFLTQEEYLNISAMVDTMLPTTDTPGAKDVGLPAFIDLVLDQYTEEDARQKIRTGLNTWLGTIREANQKQFAELEAEKQLSLLNALDTEAKLQAEKLENLDLDEEEAEARAPWWLDLKSLAIGGYFSSEQVGTEVLAYDPVPGVYQGCIPLSDVGKNWSL